MLEAFFVGRALVEVLNTRLGSLVGDTLAEVGKAEAEFRRSLQYVISLVCYLLCYLYLHLHPFYLTTLNKGNSKTR